MLKCFIDIFVPGIALLSKLSTEVSWPDK